jgi:hypothetical protein
MDMALVSWYDAFDLPPQWASFDDLQKDGPAVVRSVGWLLDPEPLDGYITLATSFVDENFGSGIHIPKSCIIEIEILSKRKKKNEA